MLAVGQTIGNYVIRTQLGEGGMGVVFLAEHPLIGKRVAIKVIHPDLARNPDAISRFFTEAQAVNRIGHPNIVDITDFGQTPGGMSYFVMELLAGESLSARIKARGALPVDEAVAIALQVADALAASHAAGILHRDLKPDNVFLLQRGGDADFVKVLDFGLAKLTAGSDQQALHRTRTGSVMGTPYYMAPEQCAGKSDIDARADVYALGVILFEMLTATVPFTGEGYGEIIVKHMTQPPPRVASLRPECPAWLDELVARTLIKERKERLQSMEELRSALQAREAGRAPAAPRERGRGRARLAAMGAVAGALAVGGVALVLATGEKSNGQRATGNRQPATGGAGADAAPVVEVVPDAAVRKVAIRVESDPEGATVTLADGTELGKTPFDWVVDASETPIEIRFAKAGFESRSRAVTPRQATSLLVDLPRLARRPPRPPPPEQKLPTQEPPEQAPDATPPPPLDDDLMEPD